MTSARNGMRCSSARSQRCRVERYRAVAVPLRIQKALRNQDLPLEAKIKERDTAGPAFINLVHFQAKLNFLPDAAHSFRYRFIKL